MKSTLAAAATVLCLVAHLRAADFTPVTCDGTYPNHLQGVCTDDRDAIFWSFTTRLVMTDRHGKVVQQVDVANHHGDLCFYQDQVFVAVNLGRFNDPKGNADSWVYVYDADDLSCVARHRTPEVFHGAGGIACHAGTFLVVGGLPDDVTENYVYEYDGSFKFQRKHTLASGHTHLGIQTAAWADGFWWFGCYDRPASDTQPAIPPALLKVDTALQHTERFEFDCSLAIVPVADGRFLVALREPGTRQGHRGRLVLAVSDAERGLRLLGE